MLFGRCYTIQFDRALKEDEQYEVRFNTSAAGQVQVYLHLPHSQFGLFYNHWPQKVLSLRLGDGEHLSGLVQWRTRRQLPEKRSEDTGRDECTEDTTGCALPLLDSFLNHTVKKPSFASEEEQNKCLLRWLRREYAAMFPKGTKSNETVHGGKPMSN